jgi:hypothetical protein
VQLLEMAAISSLGGKWLGGVQGTPQAAGAESGMMLISQSPLVLPRRVAAAALLFAAALILPGCSVGTIGDHIPAAVGGLPEGTPQRPAEQPYPAVHDVPPPRNSAALTDAERKKLEDDLVAARKRTEGAAKPAGSARNP